MSKWFVQSDLYGDSQEYVTKLAVIQEADAADESLGVAALVASRAKQAFEELKALRESNERLDERLAHAGRAQIIVEGPSDKMILDAAYRSLYPGEQPFCEFVPAGGAPNVSAYLKSILKLARDSVPIIGLYDNDHAGRKEMQGFGSYRVVRDDFRVLHAQKRYYRLKRMFASCVR